MKNSTIIVIVLAVVVLFFGSVYVAGKKQAVSPIGKINNEGGVSDTPSVSSGSVAELTVSQKAYDFGTIRMIDGNVEKVFTLTNNTAQDVRIDSIITSCMCTVAYITDGTMVKGPFGMPGHGGPALKANEIIKKGESRDVRAVFDPNAHGPAGVGPIVRQILLANEKGESLQLEIKANVRP